MEGDGFQPYQIRWHSARSVHTLLSILVSCPLPLRHDRARLFGSHQVRTRSELWPMRSLRHLSLLRHRFANFLVVKILYRIAAIATRERLRTDPSSRDVIEREDVEKAGTIILGHLSDLDTNADFEMLLHGSKSCFEQKTQPR